ncbi:MAG: DUF2085 domain-containing protein [Anaerolineales bacterium]|nr:DUF2085 domain-containing protein [Anaerolineales bacterium]
MDTTVQEIEPDKQHPGEKHWGWKQRILTAASLTVILIYLLATPKGLFNKADMVAYAICHRIPSHSLAFNQRALPLCARCSGTFMGSMVAIGFFIVKRRKNVDLPPIPILITLIGFTMLMGIDGLNSYITLLPVGSPIYQPNNTLRLITGTLHGLMMGSILYPVAMGTFWRDYQNSKPAIRNFKELGMMVLVALLIIALVQTKWTIILQIVALVSTAGVVVMLTLVNTVLFIIISKRENQANRMSDLYLPFLIGLALSLALIGGIDIFRYALTGTMQSLPGLVE